MNECEKELIYHQLTLILKEINQLMNCYNHWKEKLLVDDLYDKRESSNIQDIRQNIQDQRNFYRKGCGKQGYDYQTIALDIASILKESDIPLSTKQIHQELLKKSYMISYSNLSNNILQKIQSDSRINVERACRGFWQYRLKS